MANYKKLYEQYDDTALHAAVPEAIAAESKFNALLKTIADINLRAALDSAAGMLVRAYEMQGLNMGFAIGNE